MVNALGQVRQRRHMRSAEAHVLLIFPNVCSIALFPAKLAQAVTDVPAFLDNADGRFLWTTACISWPF